MDIIKKKICLEQFKSRFNGNMPTIETMAQLEQMGNEGNIASRGETVANNENISVIPNSYHEVYEINDWGEIPYDIVISDDDPLRKTAIPLVVLYHTEDDEVSFITGDTIVTSLRFAQMVDIYHKLKLLVREGTYYQLCKRKNGDDWWKEIDAAYIENGKTYIDKWQWFMDTKKSFTVSPMLSRTDKMNYGSIILLSPYAQWFNLMFYDDNINAARYFVGMAEGLYNGDLADDMDFTTPFANVSLYLEEEYDDMGVFNTSIEKWVAGKHYYKDDVVYYEGSAWQLTGVTETDKYDLFELTNEAVIRAMKSEVERISIDGVEKIYLKKYYECGKYDEIQMITIFDESKWFNLDKEDSWNTFTGVTTAVTNSTLYTLKSRKNSIDDEGKTMPFYLDAKGDRIFPYSKRKCNIHMQGIDMCCDELLSISYKTLSDDEYTEIVGNVISNASGIPTDVTEGQIRFIYTKNAILDEEKNEISEPYVTYTEEYYFNRDKYHCVSNEGKNFEWVIYTGEIDEAKLLEPTTEKPTLENIGGNPAVLSNNGNIIMYDRSSYGLEPVYYRCEAVFEYIHVDMSHNTNALSNEDIDSKGVKVNFSTLSYETKYLDIDTDQTGITYFKNEALLGVQNSVENIDAKIERGKSAAFERHLILGEVNTFEDLVNYRNDYFNLKKKENS